MTWFTGKIKDNSLGGGLRIQTLAAVFLVTLIGFPVLAWQSGDYVISTEHAAVYPVAATKLPKGWKPNLSSGLDNALPFPWPKKYLERGHPFNPWVFFRNASALCNHYSETGDVNTKAIIEALFDRMMEYTKEQDGKRFVLYRFAKGYRKIPVEVPWTSAYGSGAGLIGLTLISECADMPQAAEAAKQVLAGLASPIDPKQNRPRFWVSFVDERDFLWFEEKPLDQVEQPRILNGHIRALTGIYIYWVHTRDGEARKLLNAGIKTMEEYTPAYRVPGKINAYDLMSPHIDDYGPERTINQQDILYKMTGNAVFARYRDMFEADMRDEIDASKFQSSQ